MNTITGKRSADKSKENARLQKLPFISKMPFSRILFKTLLYCGRDIIYGNSKHHSRFDVHQAVSMTRLHAPTSTGCKCSSNADCGIGEQCDGCECQKSRGKLSYSPSKNASIIYHRSELSLNA